MLKYGTCQNFLGIDTKTTIHKQKDSSNYYFENTMFQTCFESFTTYIYVVYIYTHRDTYIHRCTHTCILNILKMCGIKKKGDTNEFIYKAEADSQTWRTNLWLPEGEGGG